MKDNKALMSIAGDLDVFNAYTHLVMLHSDGFMPGLKERKAHVKAGIVDQPFGVGDASGRTTDKNITPYLFGYRYLDLVWYKEQVERKDHLKETQHKLLQMIDRVNALFGTGYSAQRISELYLTIALEYDEYNHAVWDYRDKTRKELTRRITASPI